MQDPRIIECARAMKPGFFQLFDAHFSQNMVAPGMGTQEHHTAILSAYRTSLEEAQRCILKWLEQEPTQSMERLGASHDCGPMPKEIYTAMTAQAAKEITE